MEYSQASHFAFQTVRSTFAMISIVFQHSYPYEFPCPKSSLLLQIFHFKFIVEQCFELVDLRYTLRGNQHIINIK